MKLTVSRNELLPIIKQCASVADKKSTMPVLANVLIHANGALRLSSTDLYQSVSAATDANITQTGSVAVDARGLLDRVERMPDGDISISTNGASVVLKSGSRRFTMHGIDGAAFPELPTCDDSPTLKLDAGVLVRLIETVRFAISTDESRLHLNSALLECQGGTLRIVATDGHRLSMAEVAAPDGTPNFTSLLPLKSIISLKGLCTGGDKIELTFGKRTLFMRVGAVTYSSMLVDSTFPPYQDVIPKSSERTVELNRSAFASAVHAVALASNDRTGGVKLTLSPGKLRVESESPEAGEGFDEISLVYDGPEATIGFNNRYLLDALNAHTSETVTIGLSGELDAALVKPVGSESGVHTLMPMRI